MTTGNLLLTREIERERKGEEEERYKANRVFNFLLPL